MIWELRNFRKAIRTAVADYIQSEGCSCCRGHNHEEHKIKLAKLLGVKPIKDGKNEPWYDFNKYATEPFKFDEED